MSYVFGDERLPQRFWDKAVVDEFGCWIWTAAQVGNGYGGGTLRQKKFYAHRRAYEALVGPIPKELQIDHLCRVRLCCNPAHLEPVTCRENLIRGIRLRTTCLKGHPLDGLRTKTSRGDAPPFRYCLTCNRENQRELRRRRAHGAAAR